MNFQEYISPELLILIPVLYLLAEGLKKAGMKHKYIPLVLGGIGIVCAGVYTFAQTSINGSQELATALFTAFTQGILAAGASVYVNQIVKQAGKE